MKSYEYNALVNALEALKEADLAFQHSYRNDLKITEEQVELYRRLTFQLDEMYIAAHMLIENEDYRRDARKRRRSSQVVGR